jgi:hypothetical protein
MELKAKLAHWICHLSCSRLPLSANLFSQLAKFAKGNHSARLVTEDTSRRFCKALIRSIYSFPFAGKLRELVGQLTQNSKI